MKQFQGALVGLVSAQALVQNQGLAHLLGDVVQRIQGSHRLLEHHAHHPPADFEQSFLVGTDHLFAIDENAALRMAGQRIRQQLQDRQGGDGLAGAGLADQRDGLAGFDVERDAAHGFNLAEIHMQITDFD